MERQQHIFQTGEVLYSNEHCEGISIVKADRFGKMLLLTEEHSQTYLRFLEKGAEERFVCVDEVIGDNTYANTVFVRGYQPGGRKHKTHQIQESYEDAITAIDCSTNEPTITSLDRYISSIAALSQETVFCSRAEKLIRGHPMQKSPLQTVC